MKYFLVFIFFVFFHSNLISQSSYQKESLPDSFRLLDLVVNEAEDILGIWAGPNRRLREPEFCISKISQNSISEGVRINWKDSDLVETVFIQSKFEKSRLFLKTVFRSNIIGTNLFSYDINTGNYWYRFNDDFGNGAGSRGNSGFLLDRLGNLHFVVSSTNRDIIHFYTFDKETGQTLKRKGWELKLNFLPSESLFYPSSFENTGTEKFFVAGRNVNSDYNGTFIFETNKNFELKNQKAIKTHILNQLKISPDDFLYLIGQSEENFPFTENQKNAVLAKLDINLNVVWSKVLHAEKFEFEEVTLNFSPDGNPIVAYTTSGAYPTILANLNQNGEIISEKGYPLFTPKIDVLNDGSLLLQTDKHFDETGSTFFKSIIAKTDENGNIDGCEVYDARLKSTEIDLEFGSFSIDSFPIDDFEWATTTPIPYEFTFTDFCDFPQPPNPDFTLKDTICVNDCIRTDSTLGNRNAHGVEWNLEGENLQLTVEDSLEFAHCFTQPGTYTLRQTIWFLGVDYSYEKIIEVLPPLSVEIVGEEILCDLPPVDLTANSNRPLRGYEWNTGDTISSTQINEGGTYWLNANDGYCYVRDERNFKFIFEKIDTSLVINLPDSVTACEVLLPYELRPESNYSIVFENENSESNSVFLLSNSGVYEFSTEVDGCRFSKAINFKIDACKAEIFTPSAFSPNNDGINDIFLPFSPGIEPIRLSIYDRWGGKLFESNDSSIGWDGKRNGKISPDGVYVFRFEYVNLLTGLEEEISGDVTLIR